MPSLLKFSPLSGKAFILNICLNFSQDLMPKTISDVVNTWTSSCKNVHWNQLGDQQPLENMKPKAKTIKLIRFWISFVNYVKECDALIVPYWYTMEFKCNAISCNVILLVVRQKAQEFHPETFQCSYIHIPKLAHM